MRGEQQSYPAHASHFQTQFLKGFLIPDEIRSRTWVLNLYNSFPTLVIVAISEFCRKTWNTSARLKKNKEKKKKPGIIALQTSTENSGE